MMRRRVGLSPRHANKSNESKASILHTVGDILSSPALLLFIIVGAFVFIGVILIRDINDNSVHSTDGAADNTAMSVHHDEEQQQQDGSPKPLRVVLTIATNVEPQRTYLFLSSYRRWHPTQDPVTSKIYQLYLFTQFSDEKYLAELRRMAEYFSVTLVDMEPIEKELDAQHLEILNIKMKYIKINKRRFFIFDHWLRSFQNTDDIDSIFLSDANDVKFQGNIFSLYDLTIESNRMSLSFDDEVFFFFMENPDVKMDGEKWNRRYIKYCFGNDSVPLYHDLHVSCSGTSLGTYGAVELYLETMAEILLQQCPLFYDCCRKPGDQGLHNIILHKNLLVEKDRNLKMIQIPNDSGWVLQITTMINHEYWKHKVPELAEKSIVVHQWKWAQSIKAKYEKEYNYEAFCNQQEWSDCTITRN